MKATIIILAVLCLFLATALYVLYQRNLDLREKLWEAKVHIMPIEPSGLFELAWGHEAK